MPIYYLYKSKSKDKKYTLLMPETDKRKKMKHRFGAKGYRDYTMINDKNSKYYLPNKEDREKVKRAYISRHRKDKGLGSPHSPAELSMMLLWNKPTLKASIKDYEKKHKAKINIMF
tara:strand:- start:3095 stop:3442 length:348 start_codon:yes stop_codon:yes gene_type:complete